jgi:cytochrome c oxidase subunit 4
VANPTKGDQAHGEDGEHSHGVGRYIAVWLALLGFTFLTVFTGHKDLGAINLPLALTIATVKATLVILFFMHMIETPTANRIVFGVSLVFVLVLIIGVFGDLWTRNEMTLPSAAPSTEGPEISATAPITPPPAHE